MKFLFLWLAAFSTVVFAERSQTFDADCLKFKGGSSCITKLEFEALDGLSSNIQTQISGKEDTFTVLSIAKGGTNSSTSLNNNRVMKSLGGAVVEAAAITAARALISDANGIPVHSSVTSTELGYLSGATSAIQTQIDAKTAGQASSIDSEIALFSGTGGKTIKRATGTGFVKATSGVYSTSSTVNAASELTGTTPVANGGTGASSLTANNVILGNGTSAVQFVAPSTSGNILTSNGTTWTSAAPSASSTPTVQKFTSGSGTYTTPANVRYIRVRMVGGGGGGSGSSDTASSNGGNGGNGGATTFGSSLLTANGGSAGTFGATSTPAGGTASLGTGPVGIAVSGGTGQGPSVLGPASTGMMGGSGAASFFGGAGGGGSRGAGGSAAANSGSGGGGAGSPGSGASGTGGGAGAYVDAIITSPSSTYSYAVGAAGTAGAAGTNGNAGGAGGSGFIIVEEYY